MTPRDPDEAIRAWFEEGPSRGPERGLDATLARLAKEPRGARRDISMPVWMPLAAMLALLVAGVLAFGAGFRIVPPDPRQSHEPTAPPASASACRLELPVHGKDSILFGTGFAPNADVTLVFDRADGSVLTLDHSTVGSLRTDRGGGFFMPSRPYPEDLGRGRVTATAGCEATIEYEVTAADLPTACPDPAVSSEPLVDGPAYRAAVSADDPMAWWHLDDTGANAVDAAGGGHTGAYVSNMEHALTTPLSDGGSAFFHHQFPNPAAAVEFAPIVLRGDFTIETWVYFCHWADGDPIIGSNDSTASWGFGEGEVNVNDGVQEIYGTGKDVISGVWQHYVLTRADGAPRIYLNGALDGADDSTGWTRDFPVSELGASIVGAYLGYLDEVAIYDHALSAERIAVHAHP